MKSKLAIQFHYFYVETLLEWKALLLHAFLSSKSKFVFSLPLTKCCSEEKLSTFPNRSPLYFSETH